jgi:hypothetical protein
MGGIHLRPVKKHLHDNGCAAQGDEKPYEKGFIQFPKEWIGDRRRGEKGQQNLGKSSSQDSGADPFEIFERDLKPDSEEQKDDPYFCKEFHFPNFSDHSKSVGSQNNPGNEEPNDGGDSHFLKKKDNECGNPEDDDQCFQKFKFHALSLKAIIT